MCLLEVSDILWLHLLNGAFVNFAVGYDASSD